MKRAKKVNWASTPASARHNKPLTTTLPPASLVLLDRIRDRLGTTRSGALVLLIGLGVENGLAEITKKPPIPVKGPAAQCYFAVVAS